MESIIIIEEILKIKKFEDVDLLQDKLDEILVTAKLLEHYVWLEKDYLYNWTLNIHKSSRFKMRIAEIIFVLTDDVVQNIVVNVNRRDYSASNSKSAIEILDIVLNIL